MHLDDHPSTHRVAWAVLLVFALLGCIGGLALGASGPCTDDTWTPTSTLKAPSERFAHTAVWTGSELIVWGGTYCVPMGCYGTNTGGRYNPATDSWTPTSTLNAPDARWLHTAVWTGSEMIVWGGTAGGPAFNTGGRYDPATDSWTPTSTLKAPSARLNHTAVWTGTEMIVWGGSSSTGYTNTGGRYDPATDTWTPTSTVDAPVGRYDHTAVWTDTEMIVWGGIFAGNTGGRYDPATDSWTPTSLLNAPVGWVGHTAVWTGTEMIVWGGGVSTGGRYDPATDSWTPTSTLNAPGARLEYTAVWTRSEMIVWGGYLCDEIGKYCFYFNTGGRYDPATDTWAPTSTLKAPRERSSHTAVWTDTEMIVWGGGSAGFADRAGGRYCASAP